MNELALFKVDFESFFILALKVKWILQFEVFDETLYLRFFSQIYFRDIVFRLILLFILYIFYKTVIRKFLCLRSFPSNKKLMQLINFLSFVKDNYNLKN